jgi:hypothetical protein
MEEENIIVMLNDTKPEEGQMTIDKYREAIKKLGDSQYGL